MFVLYIMELFLKNNTKYLFLSTDRFVLIYCYAYTVEYLGIGSYGTILAQNVPNNLSINFRTSISVCQYTIYIFCHAFNMYFSH